MVPSSGNLVRRLAHAPVVGRVLRWLGSLYREGSVTTIRYGHAAGLRWRRHHRYVNGYWLGIYEPDVQAALARLVRPGMRVFDIGANAGFFSLVLARLVGPEGEVIAVDPDPANIESLREQATLNPGLRLTAVHAAVGAATGLGRLQADRPGSPLAKVAQDASGEGPLQFLTLDELARTHGSPDLIKMDIEGAEVDSLAGAAVILGEGSASWLIETHGLEIGRAVGAILAQAGYTPRPLDDAARGMEGLRAADHVIADMALRP
ncbi:MAG: FkbM family methyltransferase [Planctomycetota bacterium]